jgi:hypothetical protein
VREPTVVELRLGLLAVSVLHDVDLEPATSGVTLTGAPPVRVSWDECRAALAGDDPGRPPGASASPPGCWPAAGPPTPVRRRSSRRCVPWACRSAPRAPRPVVGARAGAGRRARPRPGRRRPGPGRPRPRRAAPRPRTAGRRAGPGAGLAAGPRAARGARCRRGRAGAARREGPAAAVRRRRRPHPAGSAQPAHGPRRAGRRPRRRRRPDAPARLDAAVGRRPRLRPGRRCRDPRLGPGLPARGARHRRRGDARARGRRSVAPGRGRRRSRGRRHRGDRPR